MKKKIVSLMLVAAMAMTVLAGCGSKEETSAEDTAVVEDTAEEDAAVEEDFGFF